MGGTGGESRGRADSSGRFPDSDPTRLTAHLLLVSPLCRSWPASLPTMSPSPAQAALPGFTAGLCCGGGWEALRDLWEQIVEESSGRSTWGFLRQLGPSWETGRKGQATGSCPFTRRRAALGLLQLSVRLPPACVDFSREPCDAFIRAALCPQRLRPAAQKSALWHLFWFISAGRTPDLTGSMPVLS